MRTASRMVALTICLVACAAGAQDRQHAATVAGRTCVAVLEPEVLANLPAEDRKALAGMIDTILTESLAKQKGVRTVDRQALDKVLVEKAGQPAGVAKVTATDVANELRPFWSAGVLICPVVRQVQAGKDHKPEQVPNVLIEIEAVLAQTGQSLGEAHVAATWQGHNWEKPPAMDGPLTTLWGELPGNLQRAGATQYVEIADVRLASSLQRLQWMADDLGDSLRASLARPTVALLRPRHPLSTKEERLLRVMGLSAPRGNDAAAGLACSPDLRLDAELVEEVSNKLDYDKTPIRLNLSLGRRTGPPVKQTFSGMAPQYRVLGQQASAWLNKQLTSGGTAVDEASDQEYSRQLAGRELEAARQLERLCGWYAFGWQDSGPEQTLRAKVLGHAMRAAHLDPASEEASRLVALGIDSPYWLRGHGRSSVCYDRVIAEGERYLERFGKSPQAEKVQGKISSVAYQRLTELRATSGDWISLPYNPEIWRYAKVALLNLERDIRGRIEMNLWADANLVGGAVLGHCPPNRLEEERSYWRACWKKTVEPLSGDVPSWDFVDIFYSIRKKDCAGLRNTLTELARRYPRSHQYMWGGTRPWVGDKRYDGKPVWKVWVSKWLQQCGDPDWDTWLPSFPTETYDWNPYAYGPFLRRFNPPMPDAWDARDAPRLSADRITIEWEGFTTPQERAEGFRPLLSAGGFLWLCQPPPGGKLRDKRTLASSDNLMLAPMDRLLVQGKDSHARARKLDWPPHPSDGEKDFPRHAVRCWLETMEGDAPTVWIGTACHGLARFNRKDGNWLGRWYTLKDGVPGDDILMVRPCLHQGKPKLLVLSQPQYKTQHRENLEAFLWVLDPSGGRMTLIATSKNWYTIWPNNEKSARYWRLTAVWKDGTKAPLCLYNRDDFPNLDAGGIADLKTPLPDAQEQAFMLARNGESRQVWFATDGSLIQFDGRMSPQWLLDCRPLSDEIFYYSLGAKGQVWSPGGGRAYDFEAKRRIIYPAGGTEWHVLRSPRMRPECCTSDPAVVWGCVDVGLLLGAYRPATKSPNDEHDAWYGPWRVEMGIRSIDFIGGHLWLAGAFGSLHRMNPSTLLQAAESHQMVRSTAQWRTEFRKRLGSSWQNAVRVQISDGQYDKALATIAAARQTPSATPACHLVLWEALARARQGELAAADRLYRQIADDRLAEPFARGVALINLVNVRHAAKDWPGMTAALDQLVALFPELALPNNYAGYGEAIDWYRQQARRKSSPDKPAVPASRLPSRD